MPIELSELIVFGYDFSDTQDDLGVGEMGVKHPLLVTRIKVSNTGPKGHLVFNGLSLFNYNQT